MKTTAVPSPSSPSYGGLTVNASNLESVRNYVLNL